MEMTELLDRALDFIVETQKQNDYICEQMIEEYVGDYCEKNCQNLNKEYVEKYTYNHSQPRTYAMTAYRNFELERLLNILKTIDLKYEA